MSGLIPIPSWPNRARHVIKHYFCLQERFFDLHGDVLRWLQGWNTLRAAEALRESEWHRATAGSAAHDSLEEGHGRYLQCAMDAFAWAITHREVRPAAGLPAGSAPVLSFLGPRGVVVIAHPSGADYQLRTCYRTVPRWSRQPRAEAAPWEERAHQKVEAKAQGSSAAERAAVRRATRGALISQDQEEPGSPQRGPQEDPQ